MDSKISTVIMISIALIIMAIILPLGLGLLSGANEKEICHGECVPEITKVEFADNASISCGDAFWIGYVGPEGNSDFTYVWFNATGCGDGTDPELDEGGGLMANITGATTGADVRDIVNATLSTGEAGDFWITEDLEGAWLKITNVYCGESRDIENAEGSPLADIVKVQDGGNTKCEPLEDIVDPTILTLLTVLIPILAVIGIILYFIPKM